MKRMQNKYHSLGMYKIYLTYLFVMLFGFFISFRQFIF